MRRAISSAGIRAVDLTPAARGPYVIPPVNLSRAPRRDERQHGDVRWTGDDPDGVRGVTRGRRSTTPRSSPPSRRSRPGRAPVRTSTSSPAPRRDAVEVLGGARKGKAIIILNPAEPPMIMRDTIFCNLPDRRRSRRRSSESIAEMVGRCAAVRSRLPPAPRIRSSTDGPGVAIFIEVEGAGDYLPPYSGNLDIMTAAATRGRRADRIATSMGGRGDLMPYSDQLDVRSTDTSLRDGSHAKRHQFTEAQVRSVVRGLDAAGMPVIEVTHGDGLGGSSHNYGFSLVDERVLMKAAVDEATQRQDRGADAARARHQGRHQGDSRHRRVDRAHRHPLHRGRHLAPALRPGPRARARDRGLPDDGAHRRAREAGRAGADHGRRRLPVRVRGRLRRFDDPRRGRRSGRGGRRVGRRTMRRSASTATRTCRCRSPTRSARSAPARCKSTARRAASAPARATPAAKRSPQWPTRSASAPASTCSRCSTPPKTSCAR